MPYYAPLLISLSWISLVQAAPTGPDFPDFPDNSYPIPIHYTLTMTGLNPQEGRIIRVELWENNQFTYGYYFCATHLIHRAEYLFSPSPEPYCTTHQVKVWMCQDTTLRECTEIGTDTYTTFRNAEGVLEIDKPQVDFDVSTQQQAYQACSPYVEEDEQWPIRHYHSLPKPQKKG